MFRRSALIAGLALLTFGPVMAQTSSDKPVIDIGSGNLNAEGASELSWIISAPSKIIADDLVEHFKADGYTYDYARQGNFWTIVVHKPVSNPAEVDAMRVQAESYVTAKGATFNGGGLGTPGAIQIHRDVASQAPQGDKPNSQIAAGAKAARTCFNSANTQIMDILKCVVPMTSTAGTETSRDKAEFVIGANFVSSFMFDALYNDFKQKGRDPQLIDGMRKIAVANYKTWNELSSKQHLSDEDIAAGLASDSGRTAASSALVKDLRAELESLKGKSQ